jgi:hypothetical protein
VRGTSRAIVNADQFNVRCTKMEWYDKQPAVEVASVYHKAARYAVYAVVCSISAHILLYAFGANRLLGLLDPILVAIILSAFPAGVVALCGIRKFGRKKLLFRGLVGVVAPIVQVAFIVWAVFFIRAIRKQYGGG